MNPDSHAIPATDDGDLDSEGSVSNLKQQSVRGGAITLVSQVTTVALRMSSIVVLSRLLSPEDFGLIAMVMAVTSFATIFRDLGLSSATVQKSKLSSEQLSTLHWINVLAGAVLTILVALSSPLVAWFYGRPELVEVTLALSLTFVLESLGTQPGALLTRQMQFGRHAIANIGGSATTLAFAMSMAIMGFSYWSLVVGTLMGVVARSALLNVMSTWWPGWPVRGSGIRSMLGFGANVTAFNLVNYFSRNLDNILIGSVWGADALGLYSRAYQLLMFPITNLRGPIAAVAFPALSRLQERPKDYRDYYQRVVFVLAFLSMPLTAYLCVASDVVVAIVLGPQWSEVAPIFSVLAIVAFIQPCISTIGMVFLSQGSGGKYLRIGVYCSSATVAGFLIGSAWGPLGVAVSYAITTYLFVVPITAFAFGTTPVSVRDFIKGIRNPLIASLLAGLLTWQVRFQISNLSLLAVVTLITPIYAVLYLGIFAFLPGGRHDLSQLTKMFAAIKRSKRKPAAIGQHSLSGVTAAPAAVTHSSALDVNVHAKAGTSETPEEASGGVTRRNMP